MAVQNNEEKLLRKMSRIELVEMIYALRKSNLELEEECQKLREELSNVSVKDSSDDRLDRIERLLKQLTRMLIASASSGGKRP